MRWDELAADLATQWEAEQLEATEDEIADRVVVERSRIRLTDRLVASSGAEVAARLIGADWVRGTVADVGPDWFLLQAAGGVEALVALSAVTQVTGLSERAREPDGESAVAARYGLTAVLRRLVGAGEVALALTDGTRIRGQLTGVGADTLELQRGPTERVCCTLRNLASVSWRHGSVV